MDQESASFLHGYVRDQNHRWREAFRPYWDVPLADTLSSHSPSQFGLIRPWARLAADEDLRSKLVELGTSGGVAAGSFQSLIAKNSDLANSIDAELGRD